MRRTNPTYKQFAAKHGITMDCELGEHRAGWPAGSSHWRCTLKMGRRRMTVPFSMGPAHTGSPQLDAVLNSLALDASMYENTGSAEELASELGYDDMRQARKVWSALRSQTERLKKFLDDEQYEELVWEVGPEENNPRQRNPVGYTADGQIFYPDRQVSPKAEYLYVPIRGYEVTWVAVRWDAEGQKAVGWVDVDDFEADFDMVEVVDKLNGQIVRYVRADDDPIEAFRKMIVQYWDRFDRYIVRGVTNDGNVVVDNQGGPGGWIRFLW